MLQNFLRTTELYWKSEIKCPVFGAMKKGFWSFPKVSFAKEMKVIVERRLLFFVALLEARWEFRRLSWLYHPFLWLISVEGGGVGPLLRLACLLLASVCIQHFWWQKQATSPIYRETCAWHFLHTFSLQHQIYQRQKSSDEDKLSKYSLKRQSAVVLDRFPHHHHRFDLDFYAIFASFLLRHLQVCILCYETETRLDWR